MAAHSIKTVQKIPISLEKAWSFFSDPANLQVITPATMGFKVMSKHQGPVMYAGQIIEYKVSPVLNIPLYWMTEITQVKDKEYFIDEQRFGPYSFWHHQHHFKEIPGGVEITDNGLKQVKSTLPKHWKSLTITGVGPQRKTFTVKGN